MIRFQEMRNKGNKWSNIIELTNRRMFFRIQIEIAMIRENELK